MESLSSLEQLLFSPQKPKRSHEESFGDAKFTNSTVPSKKKSRWEANKSKLRTEGDVRILVKDNKEVMSNWATLESIPYFSALSSFSRNSTSQHQTGSIDLTDFSAYTVTMVLQYVCDHQCDIHPYNLKELLQISDFLRIDSLLKHCIVNLHSLLLTRKISITDAHSLVSDQQVGIDRSLLFNLCDVAVEQGYLPMVKEGLSLGMNPNIVYEDLREHKSGQNLFFKAIAYGHIDIVKTLLASGANVNYQIITPRASPLLDERETPWIENFQAIRQRYLPNQAICCACSPTRGSTALHIAVWMNRLDMIKLLVENGARIHPDHDGETAVHFAAALGHLDILRYFVAQVYQGLFNAHTNIMGSPLFRSVISGSKDVVQFMMSHGADPHQTDYTGFTILSYAAVANNIDLVKFLHGVVGLSLSEQNDTQETALHQCASLGHINVIKYSVENDPRLLHIQDERGDTMLHVAVLYDQMKVAQLLIEAGSQVNLANYLNEHPLHIALMENCSEIIPNLLKAGANPNTVLNIRDTATPLTLAIMCGGDSTLEYVKLLLEHGADPRMLHDKALILALRENIYHKDDIIKVLLEYNGDPNARCLGTPVLMDVCAMPNSSHLVTLLLEKGASVNAINRQGQTALMVACAKDNKDYTEILLKYSADPNMASWYGLTPAMIVKDTTTTSSQQILQLLREHGSQS